MNCLMLEKECNKGMTAAVGTKIGRAFVHIWKPTGEAIAANIMLIMRELTECDEVSNERVALLARYCCDDTLRAEQIVPMRHVLSFFLQVPEEQEAANRLLAALASRLVRLPEYEAASHYAEAATRGLCSTLWDNPSQLEALLPFFIRLCGQGDIFHHLPANLTEQKPRKKVALTH